MVDILVRVVADAADRRGQQTHFHDGAYRCRAHVFDRTKRVREPARRHEGPPGPCARGAIGARSSHGPGRANRKPRGLAGLTDLEVLAKSCRPWAADFKTSLSPGGGGDGSGGYSRCHLRQRVPPPSPSGDRLDRSRDTFGPGGRRLEAFGPRGFRGTTII